MIENYTGRQVTRHAPIREQVAAILRDAIVNMELLPGQLLIERELCDMTAASRPSVREALRLLEAEGLVESQNGRGTIVAVASLELARHVYEVRAELEGLAAQRFVERANEEQLDELRAAVLEVSRAAEEGDNPSTILAAKNAVYEILFRGAANPILDQMLGTLQRRVTQLRSLTLAQPGRSEKSAAELRAILSAVEDRDSGAARAAASFHVEQAAKIVLGSLNQGKPGEATWLQHAHA